jgi:hypothetical protein
MSGAIIQLDMKEGKNLMVDQAALFFLLVIRFNQHHFVFVDGFSMVIFPLTQSW